MRSSFLVVSIVLAATPFLRGQPLSGAPLQTTKPAAHSPGDASDPGWPRQTVRNGNGLVYYQPQVDEWNNLRNIKARIAFVLTPKDGKPAVGIEELSGDTATDLENRSVHITNIKTEAVRFPSLSGAEESKMVNLLQSAFPAAPITVSLDRLIASVQASREKTKSVEVMSDPPPIFVSYHPAILLIVPGQPVLGSIKGLKLQFVVNSNWDLFFVPEESRYYLLADKLWLTADRLNGPWSSAGKLPVELSELPAGEGWQHVQKAVASRAANPATAPEVFFSDKPAELLLFAGQPEYKKISGTTLAYATNTDAWVFTDSTDDQIYYLVAGRWFRATNLKGAWTYATGDLPEDFKRIPANSDAADVLASVPGTPEADDAVLLAQIPTTAVVKRSEAESKVRVTYYGDPEFVAIEGTTMSYASNADADSTNAPAASSQNKRQSRPAGSPGSPGSQSPENANRSQTKNLQGEQEKRSRQESSRQLSNETSRNLDREASARQRGSQNVNLQQNSRRENRTPQRSSRQGRTRSGGRPQRAEGRRRG